MPYTASNESAALNGIGVTVLLKPFEVSVFFSHAHRDASAGDLVSALVKLYKDNASTLTPDPVHSAFYDSHPPALIRIAKLQGAA